MYQWVANPYPDIAPYGTIRNPGDPDFESGRYGFIHDYDTNLRYDHNQGNLSLPEGDLLRVLTSVSSESETTYDPGYYRCRQTNWQHWFWCESGMGWVCASWCDTTARTRTRYDSNYTIYKFENGGWMPQGSIVLSTYSGETTSVYSWKCNACNTSWF
jgi:hypothetical protein